MKEKMKIAADGVLAAMGAVNLVSDQISDIVEHAQEIPNLRVAGSMLTCKDKIKQVNKFLSQIRVSLSIETEFHWSDLTAFDKKHLAEQGITGLAEFKELAVKQAAMRKNNHGHEPCWTCRAIAIKFGLEV